ncbi:MAG: diacylglycerol kinase family lipid kinase [Alphaproteobacteria bacterium]|nr:diacylglycerol kinase family lipid kinase [Alphaproteobacteria bacterium]
MPASVLHDSDSNEVASELDPVPRLFVIHNPIAGHGQRGRYRDALKRLEHRAQLTERRTKGRGDARRLATEAAASGAYDMVVAAGGDGTVNEVANGLLDDGARPPALGLIPLGTANVLAAEIGLGDRADRAADALLDGRVQPITVGVAQSAQGRRRFMQMAGVGFDAHVVAGVSPTLKRWLGKGAYGLQMLLCWLRYRREVYRITIDGVPFEAGSAVVANGHYYGGTYVCAPDARLGDSTLEVCLFLRSGRLHALRYLFALSRGRLHLHPDLKIVRGREVMIEGPEGDPVQGDGDIIGHLPVKISAAPAALDLAMPLPS